MMSVCIRSATSYMLLTYNAHTGDVRVRAMSVPGTLRDGGPQYALSRNSDVQEESTECIHGAQMFPLTPAILCLRSRAFVCDEWKRRGFGDLLKRYASVVAAFVHTT
jgi:endoglucanase Acf2